MTAVPWVVWSDRSSVRASDVWLAVAVRAEIRILSADTCTQRVDTAAWVGGDGRRWWR